MAELLDQLAALMREVFEDDTLAVTRETTAADVPGWDSVQHVSLVLAVESHFGMRFKSSEVAELNNVGELLDLVARRLSRGGA